MFSHTNILKQACALLLLGQTLSVSVFAQLGAGAAQPATSGANDNSFVWRIALTVLSIGFGATLFWWRRDKPAAKPTAGRRVSDRHLRRTLSDDKKSAAAVAKPVAARSGGDSAEVDARFAAWVQANVVNKPATSTIKNGADQMSSNQKGAVVNEPAKTSAKIVAPNFELAQQLQPLEPLPVSDNAALLDAIEQTQDFDVDETTREIAILELSEHKTSNSIEALAQIALFDEAARLRINALAALGEFDHESAFEPILLGCVDVAREVRAAAARTLSRLSFDRAEAFARIVENGDAESLRLSAMACVDAGLVNHAFNRLVHEDRKQANEAFAMIRLLVAAGDFAPIINVINNHADLSVRLATIQAVKMLKPAQVPNELHDLLGNDKLPAEVMQALQDLLDTLPNS